VPAGLYVRQYGPSFIPQGYLDPAVSAHPNLRQGVAIDPRKSEKQIGARRLLAGPRHGSDDGAPARVERRVRLRLAASAPVIDQLKLGGSLGSTRELRAEESDAGDVP
jgi:hypothetical protein